MINVTAWHKSWIAYFQQKTHLSDYSLLWIAFIKGLLIGLLIYHFFININNNCLWSGNRRGGKFKYHPNNFEEIAVLDRLFHQLQLIGTKVNLDPDLTWMNEDISELVPKNKFIIVVPGSSVHLKHKRWSAKNFGELSVRLENKGYNIICYIK